MTTQSPFLEILDRCRISNIKTEILPIGSINWIVVNLNPQEYKINVLIKSEKEAEIMLGINFENIYTISKYNAYYSMTDQYIEAMLEYQGSVGQNTIYTNIIKQLNILYDEANNNRIFIKNNNYPNVKLSLGLSEQDFSILETLISPWTIIDQPRQFTTLRIENINIASETDALTILEKVGNSLLFQLNIQTDLPIYLAPRENQDHSIIPFIIRNPSDEIQPVELNFPTHEYDTEPISLYWYANTVTRMPLLQYLAYYQVIEFYFPRFQKKEAEKIIQRELQDSSFHNDIYTGMKELINKVSKFMPKSVYGNEIDALKATINNCLNREEIKSFFEENEDRRKFFDNNHEITSKNIPRNDENNFLSHTAERIYRIRCKIVHTKDLDSSDETKFILPFSLEAQKLGYDIELVQFIARKVLEHCSKPLTI
jgi:hypothetical protein